MEAPDKGNIIEGSRAGYSFLDSNIARLYREAYDSDSTRESSFRDYQTGVLAGFNHEADREHDGPLLCFYEGGEVFREVRNQLDLINDLETMIANEEIIRLLNESSYNYIVGYDNVTEPTITESLASGGLSGKSRKGNK